MLHTLVRLQISIQAHVTLPHVHTEGRVEFNARDNEQSVDQFAPHPCIWSFHSTEDLPVDADLEGVLLQMCQCMSARCVLAHQPEPPPVVLQGALFHSRTPFPLCYVVSWSFSV